MAERESKKHRSRHRAALRVAGGSAAPAGPFTPIERAIDAIRAGRMIIVVDDEDRENEGDLTIAAEKSRLRRSISWRGSVGA